MDSLSALLPGAGVVSLKVAAVSHRLNAKLDARAVPVVFNLINQQASAHVGRIRFQLYISAAGQVESSWTFYRELAYDNQGLGWKLTPFQSSRLSLPALLNDETHRFRVQRLLEQQAPEGGSSAGRLGLRIIADVDKLTPDPHDWVEIYLER